MTFITPHNGGRADCVLDLVFLQSKLVNITFKVVYYCRVSSHWEMFGCRGGIMSLEDSIALQWVTFTPRFEEAASV